MRFVVFTHSLVSDWNHGNAHFLRGVVSDLLSRGHQVSVLEPESGWSRQNLLAERGQAAVDEFHAAFPHLRSELYAENDVDLDPILKGADVVIVHEWNTADLISRIGKHRSTHKYTLLFHDTHHRSLSEEEEISRYDLAHFDGVLAYGEVIRQRYLRNGWSRQAWTWHEAADARTFHPMATDIKEGDLVWIGNWGDDERADTLREFLVTPVKDMQLRAKIYGVRYPDEVLRELADAGIEYGGWLPNYKVPEVFARYSLTVHVPRRPYVEALPGIPTIRPFEAMACGIPLISAPWQDTEHLFRTDQDFLYATDGVDMCRQIDRVLSNPSLARALSNNGLETITGRHTCTHRVDQLFDFLAEGRD